MVELWMKTQCSCPSNLFFFFFFTLLGVISCSRTSSSDGHSSWKPRKTTSQKRRGIRLSGHTTSQINNKPKHSCLLSLVTMAAGCLALQAVVWVIYCLQGSDCLCLCYYALRSETGMGPIKRLQHFEQESDWWWQSLMCQRSQLQEEREDSDWNRKHGGLACVIHDMQRRSHIQPTGVCTRAKISRRQMSLSGRMPSPCCVLRLPRWSDHMAAPTFWAFKPRREAAVKTRW